MHAQFIKVQADGKDQRVYIMMWVRKGFTEGTAAVRVTCRVHASGSMFEMCVQRSSTHEEGR